MNEEIASSAMDRSNEVLVNLKGLEPTLAVVLVLGVVLVILAYLYVRFSRQMTQPTADAIGIVGKAVTEISVGQKLQNELRDQVGDLRVQINDLTYSIKEVHEDNKVLNHKVAMLEGENRKAIEQAKLVQEALDAANKKLDALHIILAAKETRESELVLENIALRKEVQELRAQIADLQFQLNQFLKLTTEDVHEDFTPSPDF